MKVYLDGVYDSRKVFNKLYNEGIDLVIWVCKDSSVRARGSPKREDILREAKLLEYKE